MKFIQEHWEFLLAAFGFGGLVQRDLEKERRLTKIEDIQLKQVENEAKLVGMLEILIKGKE